MWSAKIRVVNDEGYPVEGAAVTLIFSFLTGYDTQYTDEDGWATFEYEPIPSDKTLTVKEAYINGELVREDFALDDEDTESFTLP